MDEFVKPDLTGEAFVRFAVDVACVVGDHRAGMTPLGRKICRLLDEAFKAQGDDQYEKAAKDHSRKLDAREGFED